LVALLIVRERRAPLALRSVAIGFEG